jgi:tetratricopeptide (TPR) repeat protein
MRTRLLLALFGLTGGASLVLRAGFADESWSVSAQTGLVVIFLAAALIVISGVLRRDIRQRVYLALLPVIAALALAVILPDLLLLFLGLSLGWLLGSQMLMREGGPSDYKRAVKAMRKQDYQKAVEHMNTLIKREPDDPQHYQFRATLHRLRDDLRRAQADYERVINLTPDSPVGPNGLAEVHLQKGNLPEARRWADEAYQKAPDDWIAVYNLGMIAERQQDDEAALRYLNEALNLKMSGSRHRLLAKFWLAKIHYRRGEPDESKKAVRELAKEKSGLREWQAIMESPESASIRHTMQDDIRMAEALANGKSLANVFDAE